MRTIVLIGGPGDGVCVQVKDDHARARTLTIPVEQSDGQWDKALYAIFRMREPAGAMTEIAIPWGDSIPDISREGVPMSVEH